MKASARVFIWLWEGENGYIDETDFLFGPLGIFFFLFWQFCGKVANASPTVFGVYMWFKREGGVLIF